MKLFFPNVWFATEKLMNNQARFFNFSDSGSLSFESGLLQFSGRKQSLRIKDIETIDLIYPPFPWISVAISMVVLLAVVGFFLTWLPFENIFMFMPFLFIFLPFMIFVQRAILWIEIVFRDEEKVLYRAYFLNGLRFDLGNKLEDTLKMYKELRSIELSKAG